MTTKKQQDPGKKPQDPGPRPADLSPQAVWPPRVVPAPGPVTAEADYIVRNGDPVKGGVHTQVGSALPRADKDRTSSLEPTTVDFAAEPTAAQRAQTRERRAPATVEPVKKAGKTKGDDAQ
jgi:hypothetical protein